MTLLYQDFIDSGWRIFGLHAIQDGMCACGDEDCPTIGKHPVAANYQHSPHWSDEQLEVMQMTGQLSTGYGVLLADGLLVIDVDARNGGVDSYARLVERFPAIAGAGLIVNTGSGGGSKHLYFKAPADTPLVQSLPNYPGIDFKSSGYTVGPGSLHKSGDRYTVALGSVADIADAPADLLQALAKPDRYRSRDDTGATVDYTLQDLQSMIDHIPNTDAVGHETYIRIGMALHHATQGAPEAQDIWEAWAKQSARFAQHGKSRIDNRWHSFKGAANPVTIGTLIHYAEENGWRQPVTFESDWAPDPEPINPLSSEGIDLLRPPGFVGEVAQWINDQSIFPRENLAVAAALMVVSNVGGMRYTDTLDNTSCNLFCFGVSDSGTGKESILQSHNELIRAAGLSPALVGGIKSEQEIIRNLLRHQAAFYAVDELGEVLAKIQNAAKRGGASYLEGIVGTLMSVFSKADSFLPITGDIKEEVKNKLLNELNKAEKRVDNNEDTDGSIARRIEQIKKELVVADMGIENPYLSIFGVTTPGKFYTLMDHDLAVNGFMARALFFRELENNPRIKPRNKRKRSKVPDRIILGLRQLYSPGETDTQLGRVERIGAKCDLITNDDAREALDQVGEYFWEIADEHKDITGLQAIPRRGYELTAKVSATLALAGGKRTVEHVQWAFSLVKRDIEDKIRLAHSNSAIEKRDAICSKIMSLVDHDHGETIGALCRLCREFHKDDVSKAVEQMVKAGALREEASQGRGRPTKRIYKV